MFSVTLNVTLCSPFQPFQERRYVVWAVIIVLYSTAENLVLAKIHEIRLPFSLYKVWSSTCSQLGNCSNRSVQRKTRKCLQWFLSAYAFPDKQPIDCMTFLNTSFYGASTGRISFQPILVGWGEVISYSHCRGAGASENQLWGVLYKIGYLN